MDNTDDMNDMENKRVYCQSCGIPLKNPVEFGTTAAGLRSKEYCIRCFQNGEFIEPDISLDDMVEKVASRMGSEVEISKEQAENIAKTLIPRLKRWL